MIKPIYNLPTAVVRLYTRLSWRFQSLVALIFTSVTHLLLCEWIVSTTGNRAFHLLYQGPIKHTQPWQLWWVMALNNSPGIHHMLQSWSSNIQHCFTYGYCTFLLLCSGHLCSTAHQLYTDWSSERDFKRLCCTDVIKTEL